MIGQGVPLHLDREWHQSALARRDGQTALAVARGMLQVHLDRRGGVDRDIEHRAHGGQQLGRKQYLGATDPHLARGIALELPSGSGRSGALVGAIHPLDIESAGIQRLSCRQGQGDGLADQ